MIKHRTGKFLSALLIAYALLLSTGAFAEDPPPPPPPGGGHGATGNQSPMGAPISGGIVVFVAFAAGVAGFELYKAHRQKKEKEVQ